MHLTGYKFENTFWRKGLSVAGADEVGRGSFAGPVVASAVAFAPHSCYRASLLKQKIRIDDSKKLSVGQRECAVSWIKASCIGYGIGVGSVGLINRAGIVKATNFAFRSAIKKFTISCMLSIDYLLIDGFYVPNVANIRKSKQIPIIRGDAKSMTIAAASIIAKVYRDSLMVALNEEHPEYFWYHNKGYGTVDHIKSLERFGPTKHHRKLFIRNYI